MIAYHIDRTNSLTEGQIVRLFPVISEYPFMAHKMFPNGISVHGFHYINEKVQHEGDNSPAFYTLEYELELIRRCYFPNLPSRYQSFFALESPDDIILWKNMFPSDCTIWEVEFDEEQCIKRDARLLTPSISLNVPKPYASISESFYYCGLYWDGHFTDNPLPELLVVPPVKILKHF